ncbi:MarR family transcriptional regulator [Actinoalloteichus hymeniacidonis]|uniref:MarR family n=1 Tax=Actinoalloteichus hymeniacidonis TaxID=340345 RepID=A0AAC9HSK1_9PSEU|nr:helix-turn-helix domain-containing protein [Actinoalloteichus hymeniacidonis]AOS64191.1 MarR family [Actinoalloteichus hymeniacidonis]MBB5907741.1 hypothetical protein [Actinoalloteichus hymeniacidonis]
MSVVLGLIVHVKRRAVFEQATRMLTGVNWEWVIYDEEAEIRGLVAELIATRHVDGVLLGPVPYDASHDVLPEELPAVVIRPSALDLALAFSLVRARYPQVGRISVDTFDLDAVVEVRAALGLSAERVAALPYAPGQRTADIVRHHRRVLADDPDGVVITMRMEVRRRLAGEIRVLSSQPVPSTIRAELHELTLRIQSHRANASRFAAGVFVVAEQSREVDVDRARVGLMNLLLNSPELAEAWVENRGRRGLVVFAHRALFERITHNWIAVPILSQAETLLGVRVAAGFGVGGSARTSVALAERAATRAESEGRACGYLVEDNGVIIGPMGQEGSPVAFTYRDHGSHIEGLARSVGLSPATISRLAAVERHQRGQAISPGELANVLGITDPSGRRLIRRLHERGLVIPEGTAQTHRKGRPTRLYRLAIDAALASAADAQPADPTSVEHRITEPALPQIDPADIGPIAAD